MFLRPCFCLFRRQPATRPPPMVLRYAPRRRGYRFGLVVWATTRPNRQLSGSAKWFRIRSGGTKRLYGLRFEAPSPPVQAFGTGLAIQTIIHEAGPTSQGRRLSARLRRKKVDPRRKTMGATLTVFGPRLAPRRSLRDPAGVGPNNKHWVQGGSFFGVGAGLKRSASPPAATALRQSVESTQVLWCPFGAHRSAG